MIKTVSRKDAANASSTGFRLVDGLFIDVDAEEFGPIVILAGCVAYITPRWNRIKEQRAIVLPKWSVKISADD